MSTSYALAVADDGCELDVLKAVSTILKPGDLVYERWLCEIKVVTFAAETSNVLTAFFHS